MKQFNHESGKIEGKTSYNFHLGGKVGDKIITAEKGLLGPSGEKLSSEKFKELKDKEFKEEVGVKEDSEYEQLLKDIDDYNKSLLTVSEEASKYNLNGNVVLIRLFKHKTMKKVGSLYIENKLVIPYQTEGGKIAKMENPLQYIHAGVINAISTQVSEAFKEKFKVGDVVHLKMGINLMQQRCWLNPEDYYDEIFDNWFLINENMIEKGVI